MKAITRPSEPEFPPAALDPPSSAGATARRPLRPAPSAGTDCVASVTSAPERLCASIKSEYRRVVTAVPEVISTCEGGSPPETGSMICLRWRLTASAEPLAHSEFSAVWWQASTSTKPCWAGPPKRAGG